MRRILITVTTIAITVPGIHAQQREAQNTPSSSYSLPTSKLGPAFPKPSQLQLHPSWLLGQAPLVWKARLLPICTAPLSEDKSPTTSMVGSGTSASCTEAAFADAVGHGGMIRFNCGGPTIIPVTLQITLRTDVNTTIDGGGQITLDGGGKTRLLYFNHPDWQRNRTVVTLQNIILQNARANGTPIAPAPAPCSQGVMIDGGGAAIFMRDGILHIWNSTFKDNAAADLGPDVAGGAVYNHGSLETMIVGSTFQGNRGSNGGAVGALWGNLSIYNSYFDSNRATGAGSNTISGECKVNGGEVGNGGSGGAVIMDGGEDYAVTVCGSTFKGNVTGSGGLGGALFRTPDKTAQATTIDRSFFSENSASAGGGALYFHNSNLTVTASTFANNTAAIGGALFLDDSSLNFTNDTVAYNQALSGAGGGIFLTGQGTLRNDTFLTNRAASNGGAAIACLCGLSIDNSLFRGMQAIDEQSVAVFSGGAPAGSGNLQWPSRRAVCGRSETACTNFSDPQLGTLADNGGPTPTAAPDPGSPAIGSGQNCPATDQRGVPRPADGCTAGAVQEAERP